MKFSRKAKREIFWILLILLAFALPYPLFFGEGGYLQLRQYHEELSQLQVENERLRAQYRAYLDRIGRLKNDPAEIERIARERYDFARPGDIIVNLPD